MKTSPLSSLVGLLVEVVSNNNGVHSHACWGSVVRVTQKSIEVRNEHGNSTLYLCNVTEGVDAYSWGSRGDYRLSKATVERISQILDKPGKANAIKEAAMIGFDDAQRATKTAIEARKNANKQPPFAEGTVVAAPLILQTKAVELEMGNANDEEAAVVRIRFSAVNPGETQVDVSWRQASQSTPMASRWHREMVVLSNAKTHAEIYAHAKDIWATAVGCNHSAKRLRPIIDVLYKLMPLPREEDQATKDLIESFGDVE